MEFLIQSIIEYINKRKDASFTSTRWFYLPDTLKVYIRVGQRYIQGEVKSCLDSASIEVEVEVEVEAYQRQGAWFSADRRITPR